MKLTIGQKIKVLKSITNIPTNWYYYSKNYKSYIPLCNPFTHHDKYVIVPEKMLRLKSEESEDSEDDEVVKPPEYIEELENVSTVYDFITVMYTWRFDCLEIILPYLDIQHDYNIYQDIENRHWNDLKKCGYDINKLTRNGYMLHEISLGHIYNYELNHNLDIFTLLKFGYDINAGGIFKSAVDAVINVFIVMIIGNKIIDDFTFNCISHAHIKTLNKLIDGINNLRIHDHLTDVWKQFFDKLLNASDFHYKRIINERRKALHDELSIVGSKSLFPGGKEYHLKITDNVDNFSSSAKILLANINNETTIEEFKHIFSILGISPIIYLKEYETMLN